MFDELIQWWKGVFGRMFGYTEMKRIAGTDVTMSQAMIDAINRWKDMINGSAAWLDESRGIISLRSEVGICRELSDISIGKWSARLITKCWTLCCRLPSVI